MVSELRERIAAAEKRIAGESYSTAVHESSHAVAFIDGGIFVDSIFIADSGRSGYTLRQRWRPHLDLRAFLCGMVAGGVGELLFQRRPISEWPGLVGIESDLRTVRRFVRLDNLFLSELFQTALSDAE